MQNADNVDPTIFCKKKGVNPVDCRWTWIMNWGNRVKHESD